MSCTAAQIAEKRKQALDRLKSKNANLPISSNNNNNNKTSPIAIEIAEKRKQAIERLKSNHILVTLSNNTLPKSPIADQIAEKRKQAIERLKAKNIRIPPTVSSLPSSISTSTAVGTNALQNQLGKAQPKTFLNNRPNPYLKPQQNPTNVPNVKTNPFLKPTTTVPTPKKDNKKSKPGVPVVCSFEVINETRFVAKTSGYSDPIINLFKTIPSKIYDANTKHWSFNITDYETLIKGATALAPDIIVNGIPTFVFKLLRQTIVEAPAEECLSEIEPTLVNSLTEFQKEGVLFGIARHGRLLIGDDMGLGKTRQALAIADFFKENFPMLIVTNASTRDFWLSQIHSLLPAIEVHFVRVLQSGDDYIDDAKIVICSYSMLDRMIDKFLRKKFGILILDESHSIKNPKAKATEAALKLGKIARRVILVSGTPALSRPLELFPQLLILDNTFAKFREFTVRYCEGVQASYGWNANGCCNLTELNVILKKKFMIRRIKSEVHKELGEKMREIVKLENLDLNVNSQNHMSEFASQFQRSSGRETDRILLLWYQSTAEIKAKAVCLYVEKLLKEKVKFLLFAHHRIMLDAVSSCLDRLGVSYMRIDGSTKSEIRTINVNRFQENEECRVAVLSLKACNSGITLTAATMVVFAELDWNPSIINQAEARAHRIGQTQTVRVVFLLAPKTADDQIWYKLNEKQKTLEKVGLCAQNEHFAGNKNKSEFSASSASSSSKAKPLTPPITNFFSKSQRAATPKKSPLTQNSDSDIFFSCGELDECSIDADVFNINTQALLQQSKAASASTATATTPAGTSNLNPANNPNISKPRSILSDLNALLDEEDDDILDFVANLP